MPLPAEWMRKRYSKPAPPKKTTPAGGTRQQWMQPRQTIGPTKPAGPTLNPTPASYQPQNFLQRWQQGLWENKMGGPQYAYTPILSQWRRPWQNQSTGQFRTPNMTGAAADYRTFPGIPGDWSNVDWAKRGQQFNDMAAEYVITNPGLNWMPNFQTTPLYPKEYPYPYSGGGGGGWEYPEEKPYHQDTNQNAYAWMSKLLNWNVNR